MEFKIQINSIKMNPCIHFHIKINNKFFIINYLNKHNQIPSIYNLSFNKFDGEFDATPIYKQMPDKYTCLRQELGKDPYISFDFDLTPKNTCTQKQDLKVGDYVITFYKDTVKDCLDYTTCKISNVYGELFSDYLGTLYPLSNTFKVYESNEILLNWLKINFQDFNKVEFIKRLNQTRAYEPASYY